MTTSSTDWIMFGSMLALSGFGLLMIYSATRSLGTFSMERQMIFVAAGLIVFLVASHIDYREYRGIVPAASVVILIGSSFSRRRTTSTVGFRSDSSIFSLRNSPRWLSSWRWLPF